MRRALVPALLLLTACVPMPDFGSDRGPPIDDFFSGPGPDVATDACLCQPDIARDPQGYEIDPPGQWYDGDVHVHASGASNDTGGDSTPTDIAKVAQERGLSFVVLTDHSNSTGSDTTTTHEDPALYNHGPEFPYWDEAVALSVPGTFVMVDGNEISPVSMISDQGQDVPPGGKLEPRGHIGCLPKDLASFDRSGAFTDRPPGQVTGGQALAQARQRGCFTVVNHPYGPTSWVRYDWTDLGYDAMEVWNGGAGYDLSDQRATDAWRCDLLAGRHTVAIGASDNHRVHKPEPMTVEDPLNPRLGWPRTAVWATELTWPALMAGLQAGRTAIHEGQSFLQVDGYDLDKRHSEGMATHWIRLRGKLDPQAKPTTVRVLRATACQDPRPGLDPPVVTDSTVLEQALVPGTTFDLAIEVKGPGVYTAELLPDEDERFGALSRAVVIP